MSPGTEQVAYQGIDQHIHQFVWNGSAWFDQDVTNLAASNILAASVSGLTSYSLSTADIQVVYLGSNQHVYQLAWTGSAWVNQDLTVYSGSNTVAASGSGLTDFLLSRGTEQVVYQGADQHVHEFVWTGSTWIDQDVTMFRKPLNSS